MDIIEDLVDSQSDQDFFESTSFNSEINFAAEVASKDSPIVLERVNSRKQYASGPVAKSKAVTKEHAAPLMVKANRPRSTPLPKFR